MRAISYWAKQHSTITRVMIVTGFLLLNFLAWITGKTLQDLSVQFNDVLLLLLSFACLSIAVYYPQKRGRSQYASSYKFRKICDGLLYSITFMLIMFFANRSDIRLHDLMNKHSIGSSPSTAEDPGKGYRSAREFEKTMRDAKGGLLKWKERKHLLKDQIRSVKKAKDLNKGEKIALIILCCLLALGLTYGLAALACSISCSGSEALAIVVLLAGLTGITLLTIWAIRRINGRVRRKKAVTANAP